MSTQQEELVNSRSRESRRKSGIFYTPDHLAAKLANWSISSQTERILDPSFGGCAFLRASLERLQSIAARNPAKRLFGIDTDPSAWIYLQDIISAGAPKQHFRLGDFLSFQPPGFRTAFDVVMGNPPYVKHHLLSRTRIEIAQDAIAKHGSNALSRMASQWAYFVLHSIQFVARGGRLAMILPGALIHAQYARSVRHALQRAFGRITVLIIRERMFEDAEEETLLLLAEGRGDCPGEVRVGDASYTNLKLDEGSLARSTRILARDETDCWIRALLGTRAAEIYDRLSGTTSRLGELATIRIGAVTGANKFFILNEAERVRRQIPVRETTPTLTRAAQLQRLILDEKCLSNVKQSGNAVHLILPKKGRPLTPKLKAYLAMGSRRGYSKRLKCSSRRPWYRVKIETPDAFLTYMSGVCPRLVLNATRATCTNTIHALRWKNGLSEERARSIAIASLSTLTQFSAELEGRSYGGGVLKLEPSEAARLLIPDAPLFSDERFFMKIEQLCATNNRTLAIDLVDAQLRDIVSEAELKIIKRSLRLLRRRRMRRMHESSPPN